MGAMLQESRCRPCEKSVFKGSGSVCSTEAEQNRFGFEGISDFREGALEAYSNDPPSRPACRSIFAGCLRERDDEVSAEAFTGCWGPVLCDDENSTAA